MKILVAPLNWGLGHASRCLPLIVRFLREGHDVVLAGDGDSLALLRKHFPGLRYHQLPSLELRYSSGNSQVLAMLCALPKLIRWSIADHRALRHLLQKEPVDMILSDNRFGLYLKHDATHPTPRTVYMTHQLMVALPGPWQWLQPLVHRMHLSIIRRYDECWVPDKEGPDNLSGMLSHRYPLPDNARFIGPLSRFTVGSLPEPNNAFQVVAVLSGLEPQRTLFEEQIVREWTGRSEKVLIVRGRVSAPPMNTHHGNITLVPYLGDDNLIACLLGAEKVIARSGYSTIMDFAALGILDKATLVPTPGQPEQEYLAKLNGK